MQINYITLEDLFTQNCGFYIPNFQREYSWTKHPAMKMLEDIEDSVKIKLEEPKSHNFFLGTLILLKQEATIGVVTDSEFISNTIYTVIDGQQRLTTLSILAAILQDSITNALNDLSSIRGENDLKERVSNDLIRKSENLRGWQRFSATSPRASPAEKPLIIRSIDAASLRAIDQWTLNGNPAEFYQSDIAIFLQSRIEDVETKAICADRLTKNSKVREVGESFLNYFSNPNTKFLISQEDAGVLRKTLERLELLYGGQDYCALYETYVNELSSQDRRMLLRGIYFSLTCDVLMERTYVVTLKPDDSALAYDMFQSINGTGVPLTTIEVIKPDLVQKFIGAYAVQVQPKITAIENFLSSITNDPEKKNARTAELICDIARAYEGNTSITKIFSAQRGFLKRVIDESNNSECLEFLDLVKHDLAYRVYFTRNNSDVDQMRSHLIQLGLPFPDADLVVLVMLYLNAANHAYAHRVLSVFYSKLACLDPLSESAALARTDFVSATKSCAAFFTLWAGLGQARFPDAVYKSLFTDPENITFKDGRQNQTSAFLNRVFRRALNDVSINSLTKPFDLESWVTAFIVNPIYKSKKAVTRFSLLVAHHDTQPDLDLGKGGMLKDGPAGCSSYLSTDGWLRPSNRTIEHIAVQTPDLDPTLDHLVDRDIYELDQSAIHRIGNLTFLSPDENPAIGRASWPLKLFFYWSLSNRGVGGGHVTSDDLLRSLGINKIPPSLPQLAESSNFVNHLAPLVQYGIENRTWTLNAIQSRGKNLATRIYTTLTSWLV
jgi:hypothetical protein